MCSDLTFTLRKLRAKEADLKSELTFKQTEIEGLRERLAKGSPLMKENRGPGAKSIPSDFESFQHSILMDITGRLNK